MDRSHQEHTPPISGFDLFWSRYPTKFNRAQAQAVWEHLGPTPEQQEALLGALTIETGNLERARRGGRVAALPIAGIWLLDHQHYLAAETVPTVAARTLRSAWDDGATRGRSAAQRLAQRIVSALFTVAFPITLAAMLVQGWTTP